MKRRRNRFKIVVNSAKIPPHLIRFAFDQMQARARQLGLNPYVRVTIHKTTLSDWYGCAHLGGGRVRLRFNRSLMRGRSNHRYPRFKDMPEFVTYGFDEFVIFAAGHEFGHSLGWGGGRDGEISCERFAARCVEAWRESQHESPACLI